MMPHHCSVCGAANREGASFCAKCGQALCYDGPAVCESCGNQIAADAVFCEACGAAVAVRRRAMPSLRQPPAIPRIVLIAAVVVVAMVVAGIALWPREPPERKLEQPAANQRRTEPSRIEGATPAAARVAGPDSRGPSIGLVDSRRVLAESPRAVKYQKILDDRERALTSELVALQGKVSNQARETRRKQALSELQSLRNQLEKKLQEESRAAVRQAALERGLIAVLAKGPSIYHDSTTAVDITDEVISRLK